MIMKGNKIMELIYKMRDLDPPAMSCVVCQAELTDNQDKQPLSIAYPHSDSPQQVIAYACRSCFNNRRDEVKERVASLRNDILVNGVEWSAFRMEDGSIYD